MRQYTDHLQAMADGPRQSGRVCDAFYRRSIRCPLRRRFQKCYNPPERVVRLCTQETIHADSTSRMRFPTMPALPLLLDFNTAKASQSRSSWSQRPLSLFTPPGLPYKLRHPWGRLGPVGDFNRPDKIHICQPATSESRSAITSPVQQEA